MATIVNGRLVPDSVDAVVDTMLAQFEAEIGDEVSPNESAVIRRFYRPWAEELVSLQNTVGLVLDGTQIDNATGAALDLLVALIGIQRKPAEKATGTVTFSRTTNATQDYVIPEGTRVQTDGADPVLFETTEVVTLVGGTSEIDAAVVAVTPGIRGNVAAGDIRVIPDSADGVQNVTNVAATAGGKDTEDDAALRARAKDRLNTGKRATASALVSAARNAHPDVGAVHIEIDDANGSFELVVEGADDPDIAQAVGQAITDTKAAGIGSVGGVLGTEQTVTTTLANGQSVDVSFSSPTVVDITVQANYTYLPDEYAGADAVLDSIVNYIGGTSNSLQTVAGELSLGDDVLLGRVEYAIRSVPGVYDVDYVRLARDGNTPSESNVTIAPNEVANTKGYLPHVALITAEETFS